MIRASCVPLARLVRLAAAAVAGAALLGACASTPPTRYHSLLPAETLAGAAPPVTPPLPIALAPVQMPAALNQSPWLVRLPDGSLVQLEQDRWTSPLPQEVHAALAERLAQRWGAIELRGLAPAWRVTLEVTRFESLPGQEARLEGRWMLTPSGGKATPVCQAVLREPVGAGTAALAAGHQRAMARLADRIGRQLRAAASGAVPACDADAA